MVIAAQAAFKPSHPQASASFIPEIQQSTYPHWLLCCLGSALCRAVTGRLRPYCALKERRTWSKYLSNVTKSCLHTNGHQNAGAELAQIQVQHLQAAQLPY